MGRGGWERRVKENRETGREGVRGRMGRGWRRRIGGRLREEKEGLGMKDGGLG